MFQRRWPATSSSRSYPSIRRKASLALRIRPSKSQMNNSDDVGFDQPPNLRFTFCEIAVRLRKRQGALLLGFEQARVFDRDHRLVGEGLEKRNLVVGEWSDLPSPEQNSSNGRYPRAATVFRAWCDGPGVLRRCCPTGTRYPLRRDRGHEPTADRIWFVLSPCRDLREIPHGLEYAPEIPRMKPPSRIRLSPSGRSPHCSVAQACGMFGHRVQHRLKRRIRDDAQHLGGGSLPLRSLDQALRALAISRLHALSCRSRSAQVLRAQPTRAFASVK